MAKALYVIAKLLFTNDLGRFRPSPFNRDVRKTERLARSMRKYGFDPGYPIRCVIAEDGMLEITSGHRSLLHHFEQRSVLI